MSTQRRLTKAEADLHARAIKLAKANATLELLAVLHQVERCALYRCFGLKTMTDYCHHQLRMSKAQAETFARATERDPNEAKEPHSQTKELGESFWNAIVDAVDED